MIFLTLLKLEQIIYARCTVIWIVIVDYNYNEISKHIIEENGKHKENPIKNSSLESYYKANKDRIGDCSDLVKVTPMGDDIEEEGSKKEELIEDEYHGEQIQNSEYKEEDRKKN